jgi:hypothetical protein
MSQEIITNGCAVLLKIQQTYRPGMTPEELYEVTDKS